MLREWKLQREAGTSNNLNELRGLDEKQLQQVVDNASSTVLEYWNPPALRVEITGRDAELEQIESQVFPTDGSSQPCVISGFGGIGKTALATAYGEKFRERFDQRIFFDFHSYSNDRPPQTSDQMLLQVLPVVAGLRVDQIEKLSAEARLSEWHRYTSSRRLLMVWDNVQDPRQIADVLLHSREGCATIITSRDRLDLKLPTCLFALEPLDHESSRNLFRQLIGSDVNEPYLERLVEGDLGIPVLLEFHAIQVKTGLRSIGEIAAELEESPLDPTADVQRRLFDRFDSSHRYLDGDQRSALRAFGAHPGPFATAASLAGMLQQDIPKVNRLMDSLIQSGFIRRDHPQGTATRPSARAYSAHDSLRAYAAHQAHSSDVYLGLQARLISDFQELLRKSWDTEIGWLDFEYECIRETALAGASAEHADLALKFADRAVRLDRYTDAETCYEHILQSPTEAGRKRCGRALLGLGRVARHRSDLDAATVHYRGAANAFSSDTERNELAYVLYEQGKVARLRREPEVAVDLFEQAKRRFKESEENGAHGEVLVELGHIAMERGHVDEAQHHYWAAAKSCKEANFEGGMAKARLGIARVAIQRRNWQAAASQLDRAWRYYEASGDRLGSFNTQIGFGDLEREQYRWMSALRHYGFALKFAREMDNSYREAIALDLLGVAAMATGIKVLARESWEEALRLFDGVGHPGEAREVRRRLRDARS